MKLHIGTCSWKYDSWRGLIYPQEKKINYLQEYSRHYRTVEVDQWFWSLFGEDTAVLPKTAVVSEYGSSVPDDFVFCAKVPNSITLTHHYRVNEDDQVTMANLIVSTTCNNEPMNRAVRKIADDYLSGVPEITEGLLNNIEVGVRAYDPCLSCATHALGQMPLEVKLIDAGGRVVDRRTRP